MNLELKRPLTAKVQLLVSGMKVTERIDVDVAHALFQGNGRYSIQIPKITENSNISEAILSFYDNGALYGTYILWAWANEKGLILLCDKDRNFGYRIPDVFEEEEQS